MKRIVLAALLLLTATYGAKAQATAPASEEAIAQGIKIVERYLEMVDFQREKTDSMLYVESKVVDRSHPKDTMTIYRWYMAPRYMRVEIWQNGRINDGYYTDGTTIFRKFRESTRDWADTPQDNFVKRTTPLDIRGALYDWRSKGSEISYAGEYTIEGQKVDRIFVQSPGVFDRYYFFEKKTGLLFMTTEMESTLEQNEIAKNAVRVDWRAWNEFTPVHYFMMPSVESYQYDGQIVIIHNKYRYLPKQTKLFSEDYHVKL